LSSLLGASQWFILLKSLDINIHFKKAVSYYYTGLFFNNFLLSFIGGDLFRIYDVTKVSGKNSESISTVFLDRLLGFSVLSTLALLGVLFTIDILKNKIVLIFIFGLFAIFFILILFFYFKNFAKRFESFGDRILPKKIAEKLREIYRGINYFRHKKKLIFFLFLLSIIIQLLRISVHYCMAHSLSLEINFLYFLIFIPVISILVLLPSIGGVGIREQAAVFLFGSIGILPVKASTIVFLAFLTGILASLPGGIFFIFRNHKR